MSENQIAAAASQDAVPEGQRATRREWIGLAVIALPCMLYSMDLTVLNLALPRLSADLQPGAGQLLWIVDIYGFLVAGFLITMGTLGDRIGRRRLLLIGAAAFGAASVLAAFAWNADVLVVARALLGIAGATLAPSTLSLIRSMFHDPGQRTTAIGVWITSYSVGAVIGPLVGGVMLEHFWWGSVFLIGVPVMLLLLVLGPALLPEYRDPNAGRLDLLSAAMSLVAVLAVIFALKLVAEDGLDWQPVAAVALGIAIGWLFVRRQRRLADPLIDLGLFRSPAFCAAIATNLLGLLVAFGTFIFMAQYLQLVLGLSPLAAGLWTVPSSVGFVVGSMSAPLFTKWLSRPAVLVTGLLLAAVGFILLSQVDGREGLAVLVAGSVVMAIGLAPVFTLTTDLIVGAAPPERAGSAAAISETGAELGGALGIAVLGSVGTAVYRVLMADAVPPGIPSAAQQIARDTLGGAVGVAADLTEPQGAALLTVARAAYAEAFVLIAVIGAAVMLVTALVVATLLRRPPEAACEADAAPALDRT